MSQSEQNYIAGEWLDGAGASVAPERPVVVGGEAVVDVVDDDGDGVVGTALDRLDAPWPDPAGSLGRHAPPASTRAPASATLDITAERAIAAP